MACSEPDSFLACDKMWQLFEVPVSSCFSQSVRRVIFASTALTGLIIGVPGVTAQTVPPAAEPEAIEKRLKKSIDPKSTLDVIVPQTEKQVPPKEAEKVMFTFSGLTISGSTVYRNTDFFPFYERYQSKEISLKTLYDIAGEITAKYGADGYFLSRAVVPAQRIKGGIAHIEIIEGFIDKIVIEGDLKDKRGFFKEYEAKILSSRPLNAEVLERYLLLGNDLNGITVKSVIRPSENSHGASNLILQIDKKAFDGSASLDNRGNKSSGPHQITLSANANNAFGMFERTTLSYIQTPQSRELKYFSLSHDQILNSEETKINFKAVRSLSKPGTSALTALDMKSKSNTLSVEVSHPLTRARAQNLTLRSGFTYKNSESFQLGQRSSQDRVRVLNAAVDYDYSDEWKGVNQVLFEVRKGVPIFHETGNGYGLKTRVGGRNDFFKTTLNLSRTQQLPEDFSLYGAAIGQWSAHELLSSEECGVGGEQFGRAYDGSEITGDHCAATSIELRYSPKVDVPNIKYAQFYGFYDIGGIWNKNATAGTDKKSSLASAGMGLRFGVTDDISGSLELAKPLTRTVADEGNRGNNSQIFFRLATGY